MPGQHGPVDALHKETSRPVILFPACLLNLDTPSTHAHNPLTVQVAQANNYRRAFWRSTWTNARLCDTSRTSSFSRNLTRPDRLRSTFLNGSGFSMRWLF